MMRKGLRRRDVLRLRNVYADLYKKGVGSILLLDVIYDLDNLGCEKERRESHTGKWRGVNREIPRMPEKSIPASPSQVPKEEDKRREE